MKKPKCTKWGCKNESTHMEPVHPHYVSGMSVPWYHFCDEHHASDTPAGRGEVRTISKKERERLDREEEVVYFDVEE